ncbi:NUDIX hydrolase [Sphaerimonospora cavernae]|uniref:NUDIX hydrolase n=1 Tax=Sphaerimonospora cavernae TaxID=1740611 RepID=A0ABV6UAG1_9ACTN
MEPIPRLTARIILVDAEDHLLLLQGYGSGERQHRLEWTTPGGRVGEGESLTQTASRELREETGLLVPPADLGPVVAVSSGTWRRDGTTVLGIDTFFYARFYARMGETTVKTSGRDEFEQSLIVAHHWWSIPELRCSNERVFPSGLAGLVAQLIGGNIPATPVALSSPW